MSEDEKTCGKPCEVALNQLENIDDDAGRHGIKFVKSTSAKLIKRLGIAPLPALIYFDNGTPVRYNGKRGSPSPASPPRPSSKSATVHLPKTSRASLPM